jgi:hypothetical protein
MCLVSVVATYDIADVFRLQLWPLMAVIVYKPYERKAMRKLFSFISKRRTELKLFIVNAMLFNNFFFTILF